MQKEDIESDFFGSVPILGTQINRLNIPCSVRGRGYDPLPITLSAILRSGNLILPSGMRQIGINQAISYASFSSRRKSTDSFN